MRDAFDHWLAGVAEPGGASCSISRSSAPRSGCAAAPRRTSRARPRRASCGCPASSPIARTLPRKALNCSSSRAIWRAARPSRRATARRQAVLPLRGKILNVASATRDKLAQNQQLSDLVQALGVGVGAHYRSERPALRQDHHHDRRRRRRRPYRLAADHLLLPPDAEADRGGPSLSRRAAALPADAGRRSRSTPATTPTRSG